ncbi:MAG: F0F1 ATP synthase subunit B' [Rhodobacteraceae bacterium]|nr:F0F1 ATP synthase subunit B' [Paracoccaceae bacterium]
MATETEAAGHAAEAAAHGAEAVGMPQLDFTTFPNQIFWLAVALVAIYLILTRSALPRIAAVLAERRGTITNDIAAAEELKRKAEAAEHAYEAALAEARSEAARIVAEVRAEMQADLAEALARADAEIGARAEESGRRIAEIRAAALDTVGEVARDTSAALVAALGGNIDDARIARAVAERMKG